MSLTMAFSIPLAACAEEVEIVNDEQNFDAQALAEKEALVQELLAQGLEEQALVEPEASYEFADEMVGSGSKFANGEEISGRTSSKYIDMMNLIKGYFTLTDEQKSMVVHLLETSNYRPIDGDVWPYTNKISSYKTSINDGTYNVSWGLGAKGCLSYSRYATHLIYGNGGGDGAGDVVPLATFKEYIQKYAQPGEMIHISNWNQYIDKSGEAQWNSHELNFLASNNDGFYTVSYFADLIGAQEVAYAPKIYYWGYDYFVNQARETGSEIKLNNINPAINIDTSTIIAAPSTKAVGLIYNGHGYQLFEKGGYTWTMAKAYCDSIGGHLVSITDANEQDFIKRLINYGVQKQYWIGLYREQDNNVLTWVTGEPYSYSSSWGNLDKTHRKDGEYENYCQIYRLPNPAVPGSGLGTWNDMYYDNTYPGEENYFNINNVGFICEWDSIPSGYSERTNTPFVDVNPDLYYGDAVRYAYFREITTGTTATTFAPDAKCTRAQVVTFLWRTYGSPEPTITTSPFTDVQNPNDYYYKAVLWAVENKITTGTSPTKFSPNQTVTRGQFVTFLYRISKEPYASNVYQFNDVKDQNAFYYKPVCWAYRNDITTGTSSNTFSPNAPCTRGQVVTFIYRFFGK